MRPLGGLPSALHLASVWNPTYAADALDAHPALLVARVREAHAADDWSEAYVWSGTGSISPPAAGTVRE